MPTMFRRGVKAAQQMPETVRCCAKHTTGQKEIGNVGSATGGNRGNKKNPEA